MFDSMGNGFGCRAGAAANARVMTTSAAPPSSTSSQTSLRPPSPRRRMNSVELAPRASLINSSGWHYLIVTGLTFSSASG